MIEIEEFFPTENELLYGVKRIETTMMNEPSDEEKRRYIRRITQQMGAIDPDRMTTELLSLASWDGQMLTVDGIALQRFLRIFSETEPEHFKPNGDARLQSTLAQANSESNATLLDGPKLRRKFIEKYGQERLDEIQVAIVERERRERVDAVRNHWLAARETEATAHLQGVANA